MYLQSAQANSTSNPISLPEASLEFHGGYAPYVPILILSAKAFPANNKSIVKKEIIVLFNFLINPPLFLLSILDN